MAENKIPRIRRGNDIKILFSIIGGGTGVVVRPEDVVSIMAYNDVQKAGMMMQKSVEGGDLYGTFPANEQHYLGAYRIVVRMFDGSTATKDTPAFELVATTAEADTGFGPVILQLRDEMQVVNFITIQEKMDKVLDASVNPPYIGENGNWFVFDVEAGSFVDTGVKAQGPKGDAFKYSDFTPEQLAKLKGPKGDDFKYSDFTPAQLAALRGPQGEPFRYSDFTPEQIADLKRPATEAAENANLQAQNATEAATLATEAAGLAEAAAREAGNVSGRVEREYEERENQRDALFLGEERERNEEFQSKERERDAAIQAIVAMTPKVDETVAKVNAMQTRLEGLIVIDNEMV